MKKKIAIGLALLMTAGSIAMAEATYCEPVGNNGGVTCYSAEDAYKAGERAGYVATSITYIKVPSEYSHFASDYKNGLSAGYSKRQQEKKLEVKASRNKSKN